MSARAAAILAAICLCLHPPARSQTSPVAAQAIFNRAFPQPSISYLLIDGHSGAVIAQRWPQAAQPIPIGSLIKPFTAMAWAATRRPFPEITCRGTRDACWRPHGHGRMTLTSAITQSCNAYFLALGRDLSTAQANATLADYGFPPVNAENKAPVLAGLSGTWRVAPQTLAAAYLKLRSDAAHQGFQALLQGMRQSATKGTARAVALSSAAVLAKTGTAPCTHTPRAMADGFTVLFFPAEDPRLFLLVREHGVIGADTAAVAGQMLRALDVPGASNANDGAEP